MGFATQIGSFFPMQQNVTDIVNPGKAVQ